MLKTTLRNLYREKLYASINIFGLSLAIACCLILGLYLKSELTYDQHFTKHKQIFRVVNEFNINGKIDSFAITSQALGSLLTESYPEIMDYVRFRSLGDSRMFRHDNDSYYWENAYLADTNIFKIFSHDIIYGTPETALEDPASIAVSETFARKYFGDENPIGKTVSDESKSYKITLVFTDLPENTHLKYDVLLSFNSVPAITDPNVRRRLLLSVSDFTYLLMEEGYDANKFKEISDSFFERHLADMAKSLKASWRCWVQPLADVHFHSKVGYDLVTGNIYYIYGFMAVGIFILLVACINYMNLATARASRRSHEVGMKKILGSGRRRLVFQFMGEAIFFLLLAMVLGVILAELILTLTPLNDLLDKPLSFNPFIDPRLWKWVPALLGFGIFMGLLSGIYPAFYLSSVLPLSALIGGNTAGKGNIRFRQVLVLIQFIITVGVIACTIIMTMQMKYVSGKDLGFNKENRLIITLRGADLIEKIPTVKKELLKNEKILGVATTGRMIGQLTPINVATIDNNEGVPEETGIKHISVGDDYLKVMGMELLAGRDFSKKLITDIGHTWVVNEALVKKMGWDQPLGKHINLGMFSGQVRGVVKDFHFASLHSEVEPFGMHQFPDIKDTPAEQRAQMQRYLVANIAGEEIFKTLKYLEDKFAEFDPTHPFTYEFLDDSLKKLYIDEQRLMKLTGIFAGVCILISCLGLFGLSSYATEQRTREIIGIRKVLGASTWQIITLLAQNILMIVVTGAVIASILAYFTMDEWLSSFAYKTDIEVWVFLLSAIAAAAVAFITVALQSFKTAQTNPVDTIRYE